MERQFCSFVVEGFLFGVEVSEVQEVLSHQTMTAVPLAPPAVGGLINLRGQIVMAIDPRRRLGLPPGRSEAESINVIMRTEDRPVSLLVDAVGDILDLGEEQMEPSPETVRGEIRGLILGIYKLPDRLLLILDTERVADFDAATESVA